MALWKRLITKWFLILLHCIVNVFAYIFDEKVERRRIPPAKNNLLNISATKLAESIRKSEISSEELVTAYINRILEVNMIVNAVVDDRFSQAIAEAREVDKYLKSYSGSKLALESTKPLLGIPITVKESLAVKGLSYTGCSLTRKGIKAEEDAEAISLLKEAGAIILLVSSTPEYCTATETYNNLIGMSKNPYDTRYGCGGSSGGEGALIGAGASIVGIGTDMCGSIRIPCAFNGIYGHKPTSGIVPITGSFPWYDDERCEEYLVVGPMVRYVEDLKLILKVLAGNMASILRLDDEVNLQNINVFYMVDSDDEFCLAEVNQSIQNGIEQAVTYLSKKIKCTVHTTKFSEMQYTFAMAALLYRLNNCPNVFTDSEIKYNVWKELLKYFMGKSIFPLYSHLFSITSNVNFLLSEEELEFYSKKLEELKEKFTNTLGSNGVFLYPIFSTEAYEHKGYMKAILSNKFLAIFNLLGCPSTCVPIGLNEKGLPNGIQVVATPNQDNLTIQVATELDKYFGGWRTPYQYNSIVII